MISPVFLFISGSATPPEKVTPKLTCLDPIVVVIPLKFISTDPDIGVMVFVVDAKLTTLLLQ